MKVWGVGVIFWLTAVSAYATGPSQNSVSQPNVFLITIDTLRADHIHSYGYDPIQTPALDGLAKDGIRFTETFTPSPITNISHTTILTGLLPSSHGVNDFAVPLAATHPTWAELLHERGYNTAAFIGSVVLDSNALAPGLDRGFDFYDNFPERPQTQSRWGRVERRGTTVVQHAETWLNANRFGPHFIWVHLYDPHDPYEPPLPYSRIYKDHLYDGEIAYADSALSDFVKYLKNRRWYDNSVIIVVGDHGEGLGEHHEDTHGIFLYDSTTRVPLIVKLPGAADAGRVVHSQVRTTDILPTILDLLQVHEPVQLDGVSLRPLFAGSSNADRRAIGETAYPLHFGWAPLRSVRAEGFKLIEAPRPELYALGPDPGEVMNIYGSQDRIAQNLRAMLGDLPVPGLPSAAPPGPNGQLSAAELKALDYGGATGAAPSTDLLRSSSLPDPKDGIEQQNLLHLAMLALEDSHFEQARELLEKVLQLNPKSSIALRQLGQLELEAGEYVTAAEHLGRAREMNPDDATVAFDEGKALAKSGDLPGARDALEASLKLDPGQFSAHLLLGAAYLSLKSAEAADDQFEAALLLKPKSVEAQLGAAEAQIAEGGFGDALQQLEHLLKIHPRNADALRLLAQVYNGLGNREEAARAEHRATLIEQGRVLGPGKPPSEPPATRRE
jgi:choline-sulfatase